MNEELEEQMLEEFSPEIEKLDADNIFNEEIFNWLFAITNLGEREKQIIKLQNRAKQLGIITNFKKILSQYEKEYLKEGKLINRNIQLKHNEVAEKILKENSIILYK